MQRYVWVVAVVLAACDPGVQLGTSCEYSSQCPAGLVCGFGRCRSECREQRDCSLGALCLRDEGGTGTCALPDDPDCRDAGETCAAGLACIGGECVNACASVAECPPGSQCVPAADGRARCVRDDADAGTPTLDASMLDGTIEDVDAGAPCPGAMCDPVAQIAVGMLHVCARTESGAIWCWGTAAAVGAGEGVTFPSCEDGHQCTATPLRAVRVDPSTGTEVAIAGAIDVAAGEGFTCAILRENAQLWCWGSAATGTGELGQGHHALRVRLASGGYAGRARDVGCSRDACLALMEDGTLLGWGGDEGGLLGSSAARVIDRAEPFAVTPDALGATRLWVGGYHACVLRGDGEPWCWGWNDYGQLGRSPPAPSESSFDAMAGHAGTLVGASTMGLGNLHGCAIVSGDAWCWGDRLHLGVFADPPVNDCSAIVDRTCSLTPVRVFRESGSPFVALGAMSNATHDCALTASGEVWCWGASSAIGPLAPYREPVRVFVPAAASAISVGESVACAIAGGDAYCWGANGRGQLGRGLAGGPDSTPRLVEFTQ